MKEVPHQIKIPVLDFNPQYEQIKDEVQGAINRFFFATSESISNVNARVIEST